MVNETQVVDVSRDWTRACDVQQRFMAPPSAAIEGLDFSVRCRQVRAVGGDGYCLLPLSRDRLALAIGDASGKSLSAALMMSSVLSSLRTAAAFVGDDPVAVVGAVNSHACPAFFGDPYATLFYGVFDRPTRTLRYVNGGHTPPVVIREDGLVAQLETGGLPVGVFPDSRYEQGQVALRSGDLIVAYTDGVTEAEGPAGEAWGLDGLLAAVDSSEEHSPEHVSRSIFGSMDAFSQGRQADDATVIAARMR